jgi:probable HAF family extracellular repeat protein
MRSAFYASLATACAIVAPAAAGPFTFTPITGPQNYPSVFPYAINNSGAIALQADGNGGVGPSYIYSGNTHTQITFPGVDPTATYLQALNNSGGYGGAYVDPSTGNFRGFVYLNGQYKTVVPPGGAGTDTFVYGLNDHGEAVGSAGGFPTYVSFSYLNGQFTTLTDPNGPTTTAANGVNNAGDVVGSYIDSNNISHGFLLHNGQYTTLDVPGAAGGQFQGTAALNISNTGEIVGWYNGSDGLTHGFTYQNGVFDTVDYPFASGPNPPANTGTFLYGVNDEGQLVGQYTDAHFQVHAFVATPTVVPEPGALSLLAVAGAALAVRRRRWA